MNIILTVILIGIFLSGIIFLKKLKKKKKTFNYRVLTSMILGLILGGILQLIFSNTSPIISGFVTFTSIFSTIYVNLLKLIVIPLILVSISMAIIESKNNSGLAKKIQKIISVLLLTVAIAAIIGTLTINFFNIDANNIVAGNQNNEEVLIRQNDIEERQQMMQGMTYADYLVAPIPTNFSFLVGSGATAALSTVLFGAFLGYATLQIDKRKPEKSKAFITFLASLKEIVLSMVREILKLTPFGIFALMTEFMATSSLASLGEMIKFLIATYVAIIIMYLVHVLLITINGISPKKYIKKTWPVLLFGFGSRSSMAAIPLNVSTQVNEFEVDESTANLSATLGATIGQNGCAGIYPAMLAVMGAQIAGVEMNLMWYLTLIFVIILSSFGIAGVGGGATFAAIAVLTIMGLPIEIAAILISIEPLLDMARTALNISDSMLTGIIVDKRMKTKK